MYFPEQFDVIVVGGGHAGAEAALVAARMGKQTLLVTQNFDTLGQLSCNPSIGGIGKGHLVKEVDAMGGVMALSSDEAGIQFRILNSSKGPAVRATRAQIDRNLYRQSVRFRLENQKNLFLFQQQVDDLVVQNHRVEGVVTEGKVCFKGKSVVLSVGTFLDGKIYVGLYSHPGGRAGDAPAVALAHRLRDMDLPRGRLKTGTPPRIDGRTVDFSVMEKQDGDADPVPVFSFLGNSSMHPPQLPCWITHTNPETHEIIRGGLDRSPLFTGMIEGVGPRYCPSIEDKIHRFSDKSSHQIFLEPEGLRTHEYYPNGISTSLPFDTQIALVHSMKGMEKAHILRPGYAIEYDYFDPRSLKTSLETRQIAGLFFAGQINGTTGYEEAAAQGLVAGINACRYVDGKEAWVPKRSEAYMGVMLDDLVTRGVQEPYRMFTSRAEYRLSLREDNADIRLTETAYKLGCISQAHWERFERKREQVARELERMKSTWVHPCMLEESEAVRVLGKKPEKEYSLTDLLKRPDVSYELLMTLTSADGQKWTPEEDLEKDVREQVEIQTKYAGYIERQERDVRRQQYYENLRLPDDLPYTDIPALSVEVRQRLEMHRPETLGQASRISGVTPAAISLLLVYLKKRGLVHFSGDRM